MLIRLLGEDSAAMAYAGGSHFTDLPDWPEGRRYISYGYQQGYTAGSGGSTFSPNAASALEQYLTFVLRSLGYRDGEDFLWDSTCRDLALDIGLLTREELEQVQRDGFRRDHVALISFRALRCRLKDGSTTLGQRLVQGGAVSAELLEQALAY